MVHCPAQVRLHTNIPRPELFQHLKGTRAAHALTREGADPGLLMFAMLS